mgnify:CR=1 FL=1
MSKTEEPAGECEEKAQPRMLVVWDFDHTLVNDNTGSCAHGTSVITPVPPTHLAVSRYVGL